MPDALTLAQPSRRNQRLSAFALMSDRMLGEAIEKLERICSQPWMRDAAASVRAGYQDALSQAVAELDRRRV